MKTSFLYSVVGILFFTAIAKLVSALGNAPILDTPEPVLGFSYRQLLLMAGALEALVVVIILVARKPVVKLSAVAWLICVFMVYRIGSYAIDTSSYCPCLGTLTEMLAISPKTADRLTFWLAIYMLTGSFGLLLRHFSERRTAKSEPLTLAGMKL